MPIEHNEVRMTTEHLELPEWRDAIQTVPAPDIAGRDIDPRRVRFNAYVSGPMTGRPRFNFDAFDEAEALGRSIGWTMISPAAHDRNLYPEMESWPGFADGDVASCPDFDFHKAMVWDLQEVARADAIVLLPGWTKSTGAGHELDVALACGKRIFVTQSTPGQGVQNIVDFLEIDAETCTGIRHSAEDIAALNGEHRVVDPTTGGAKGSKDARFDLIPGDALLALAEHYGRGAKKYDARNWEKGYAWSLSFAAMQRHAWALWNGELIDDEGFSHATAIAFHAFALYRFSNAFPELDDRPTYAG